MTRSCAGLVGTALSAAAVNAAPVASSAGSQDQALLVVVREQQEHVAGQVRHRSLEPSTGFDDDLSRADAPVLAPGATRRWTLTVHLGGP